MDKNSFFVASDIEIKEAKTTDVYFLRTEEVLKKESLDLKVVVEVTASSIKDSSWGIIAGIEDVLDLLEGMEIDVYSMPEGSLFQKEDDKGVKIPTIVIIGKYLNFAKYETPLLGFICSKSGMTTKTARIRLAAEDKSVLSFGARRAHPAITPVVSYCAFIGGCDGISCILGAEKLGILPTGTIPHSLIILFQDQVTAWKAFDTHVSKVVPRIALVDTYYDEKTEAILAAEAIPDLAGVRLDTPSSRKGNFKSIIQEVRWELDQRGYKEVKIYISGGLREEDVLKYVEIVDGFGIGSEISAAPPIDFALDIVALEGKNAEWKPVAKRGKFSGRKNVLRCDNCLKIKVTPWKHEDELCETCKTPLNPILVKQLENGKRIREKPSVKEIRKYVLNQLELMRK
ncbi:MAG: nicotinate phosphoribosyltransferase [Candidatus Hodarchaeales archaeon]